MPHFLGKKPKRDPHKLFRGDFGGQKRGPKWAIFGHKKFSLLFFPGLSLVRRRLYMRDNGTICPFFFFLFPCFVVIFLPKLRPIYVVRPSVVLLAFPLFYRHFG